MNGETWDPTPCLRRKICSRTDSSNHSLSHRTDSSSLSFDPSTDCSNYALTDCYHLIVIVNFKLPCSNLPHPAYQAKSREDESHEDNHGDYHADRHLLRGRGSICMIHDKSVVIIYDKKEFSIERMFRPSLVFPSTL